MSDNRQKSNNKIKDNVHKGHRGRLLSKYIKHGIDSLEEHEVLELILYLAYPYKDMNPKAHRLIEKFGSLENVLNASVDQLLCNQPGNGDGFGKDNDASLTERAASILTLIRSVDNYIRNKSASNEAGRLELSNIHTVGDFCCKHFGHNTVEVLNMIVVDSKCKLKCVVNISTGNVRQAYADVEKILIEAVRHNASGIILCHNHPGGNLEISNADTSATSKISTALNSIGITLIDHIICYKDEYESMMARGMIMS